MKSHFDDVSTQWDTSERIERAAIIAHEIRKFIPLEQYKNILEFGCGTGLLSFYLRHETSHFTLLDASMGMIEVVKQKIETQHATNFTAIHGDLSSPALQDESFDVIYSSMSLHHVADIEHVGKRFGELLQAHGYLCIIDLTEEDGAFHQGEQDFHGHHGFNVKTLAETLSHYGLRYEDAEIFYHGKKNKGTHEVAYSLFILLLKKEHEK